MGRRNRRGLMSEQFKYELAKDLGIYETVQREGWAGIRTKDAGNLVKRAIQIAEQALVKQQQASQTAAAFTQPVHSYRPPASIIPQQHGYAAPPVNASAPPAYMYSQTGRAPQPQTYAPYGTR